MTARRASFSTSPRRESNFIAPNRRHSIQLTSIHPQATGREDGVALEFPRYVNPASEPAHRRERHCVGTVKTYADYLLAMSNEWRSEFFTIKSETTQAREMMEQATASLKGGGELNAETLEDLTAKSWKKQKDLMSRMMAELQGDIREEYTYACSTANRRVYTVVVPASVGILLLPFDARGLGTSQGNVSRQRNPACQGPFAAEPD